jgi:hypothetical protein
MLDVNKQVKDFTIVLSVQKKYVQRVTALTMSYVVETYKESQ